MAVDPLPGLHAFCVALDRWCWLQTGIVTAYANGLAVLVDPQILMRAGRACPFKQLVLVTLSKGPGGTDLRLESYEPGPAPTVTP